METAVRNYLETVPNQLRPQILQSVLATLSSDPIYQLPYELQEKIVEEVYHMHELTVKNDGFFCYNCGEPSTKIYVTSYTTFADFEQQVLHYSNCSTGSRYFPIVSEEEFDQIKFSTEPVNLYDIYHTEGITGMPCRLSTCRSCTRTWCGNALGSGSECGTCEMCRINKAKQILDVGDGVHNTYISGNKFFATWD